MAIVAQVVRVPGCGPGGRRFKSDQSPLSSLSSPHLLEVVMQASDKIFVAIDVDSSSKALSLVTTLKGHVGVFKVGLELIYSEGTQLIETMKEAGADRIFFDAKLHDIPNTVAGAMRAITRLGIWCVTLHVSGGSAMLQAAREAAEIEADKYGVKRPLLMGVTTLTSISSHMMQRELQIDVPLEEHVVHLACMARQNGCDGVIASPQEIHALREALPDPNFLIVTPGVRPVGSSVADQARVLTPAEAIRAGASGLVIGRPIVQAANPCEAADAIAMEIASA